MGTKEQSNQLAAHLKNSNDTSQLAVTETSSKNSNEFPSNVSEKFQSASPKVTTESKADEGVAVDVSESEGENEDNEESGSEEGSSDEESESGESYTGSSSEQEDDENEDVNKDKVENGEIVKK